MTISLNFQIGTAPGDAWVDKPLESFEELYRRHYPQLVALCRRQLGGRGDAEATAQEAFVRAWTSRERFAADRPFWPWLATIARRLCSDTRRRAARESTQVHVTAAMCDRHPIEPDEVLEAQEECHSALRALYRLKPSEQRVIALRDVNGWSYEEIARFEGVTIESIRGSLKRARAALRKSYEKLAAGAPAAIVARHRGRAARLAGAAQRPMALPLPWLGDVASAVAMAALAVAGGATTPASTVAAVAPAVTSDSDAFMPPPLPAMPVAGATSPTGPRGAHSGAADGGSRPGTLLPAPDDARAPEDVVFDDITPSPSYAHDGTLFASGFVKTGCNYGACTAVFRSTDRGQTWQRLPATGYVGGPVMLSPAYPLDARIFVAGPAALQISEDGGASFSGATPVGGAAAISPSFADDGIIAIGQAPGWEYHDGRKGLRPARVTAASTSLDTIPVFSPDFTHDQTLFVGGTTLGPTGAHVAAIFRCVASMCGQPATLDGVAGSPKLVPSPAFAQDGLVFAWRGDQLYRSDDHGNSFGRVDLPRAGVVTGVAVTAGGGVYVGTRGPDGTSGGVVASRDGGRTWRAITGPDLRRGVEAVEALPDGRLLAAVSPAGGGGLVCSVDGGATWQRSCAP